jgi:hypothetical protein
MWKQPWKYSEGWAIAAGFFVTGVVLQYTTGSITPESFRFPLNVIFGALYLLFLGTFHLLSGKVKPMLWFAGPTAAITSVASMLVLIIIMGFTRQISPSVQIANPNWVERTGLTQMVVSWPFVLMLFYMLAVLGLVILRRASALTRRRGRFFSMSSRSKWQEAGFFLNHGGLFILLFAALLGSSDFRRFRMSVSLNEVEWRATDDRGNMVELPLAIELYSFTIDEYPPKLMMVDNQTGSVLPAKRPLSVSIESDSSVVQLLQWELEVVRYHPSAATFIRNDTMHYVPFYSEGATSALYLKALNRHNREKQEGWVSNGSYLFPFSSLRLDEATSLVMPNREPLRYASEVKLYSQSGETKEGVIAVNKPLSLSGWRVYQTGYDAERGKWSRYSLFEVVRDPWLPAVWLGIGLMLAGCIFLFLSAPEKKD